jgi:hypothetical protein
MDMGLQMIKQLPTKEFLNEIFEYCDGNLYQKQQRGSSKQGAKVGWIEKNGYVATDVNNIRYKVHRLIYQYHFGFCPEFLDHIDCDKTNNKIENLRPATVFENNRNRKVTLQNKSGLKGAFWDKQHKKWKASIKINNKSIHLGHFENSLDAHLAYKKESLKIHGEFANY